MLQPSPVQLSRRYRKRSEILQTRITRGLQRPKSYEKHQKHWKKSPHVHYLLISGFRVRVPGGVPTESARLLTCIAYSAWPDSLESPGLTFAPKASDLGGSPFPNHPRTIE